MDKPIEQGFTTRNVQDADFLPFMRRYAIPLIDALRELANEESARFQPSSAATITWDMESTGRLVLSHSGPATLVISRSGAKLRPGRVSVLVVKNATASNLAISFDPTGFKMHGIDVAPGQLAGVVFVVAPSDDPIDAGKAIGVACCGATLPSGTGILYLLAGAPGVWPPSAGHVVYGKSDGTPISSDAIIVQHTPAMTARVTANNIGEDTRVVLRLNAGALDTGYVRRGRAVLAANYNEAVTFEWAKGHDSEGRLYTVMGASGSERYHVEFRYSNDYFGVGSFDYVAPVHNGVTSLGLSSRRWMVVWAQEVWASTYHTGDIIMGGPGDEFPGHILLREGPDGLYIKNERTGQCYRLLAEQVTEEQFPPPPKRHAD